jgi:5-methylthioadenosine/S-adenosylhomocysteine deaminase
MFEEMRLAALLAKTVNNDPTVLPARQALELATISGARAVHMADITGSLEVGKRADIAVVEMTGLHNWPHFHNNAEAVYSRLVYAAKSTDVTHVVCNGRWLMRDRALLTVDEAKTKEKAAGVAAEIDTFVLRRESSPYNKLVLLAGVQRQESFEVQVKVPLDSDEAVLAVLLDGKLEINKQSHYKQFDHYFVFHGDDPDASLNSAEKSPPGVAADGSAGAGGAGDDGAGAEGGAGVDMGAGAVSALAASAVSQHAATTAALLRPRVTVAMDPSDRS